jgi:outer membrane protein assembly factor BamB
MKFACAAFAGVLLSCLVNAGYAQETSTSISARDGNDWLYWRGPNRNGIVDDQTPVTEFGLDSNVLWKTKVPGRGHSSPTIIGDKVFLTTSVATGVAERVRRGQKAKPITGTQHVICYDRSSGEEVWNTVVHTDGLTGQVHRNNSRASHTIATDGRFLFCVFVNNAKVMLTKLGLDGEQVWQKEIGEFASDFGFGAGASPILWNEKLYVTSECSADPFIVALDLDGEQIWRADRPSKTSYSTPVIANVAGKDQLLQPGGNLVTSYNPETGEELWSVPTNWAVSCATMVWDDNMVFASGGFPNPQTLGINAETGDIVWENQVKCYEQSMLLHDGHVYGLVDNGVCYCWEAATGKEKWKQRMQGKVSASPVMVGGHIYFTSENGSCFVIKPNTSECEIVAENDLGDSAFATPSFVDNKIYSRVGVREDGNLQEYLFCLGN